MAQNSSAAPKRDINAVLSAHDKDRRTPCLKVMLARKNPETERQIPPVIEGYPVVTEVTGEIRALGAP